MTGFETALNEITLVLFTTLAPSAVCAYCLMAILALKSGREEEMRLNRMLLLPFLVCLIGLVASATHLGNPDNALYVFARTGASPLSNEVFAAVVFLGTSGLQWLYQFADHVKRGLLRALLLLSIVSGIVFLAAMSMAYSGRTIITWDTPMTPIAMIANALMGGPLLALLGLVMCGSAHVGNVVGRVVLSLSVMGWAASVLVYCLQGAMLDEVVNGIGPATKLVPCFDVACWTFAVVGLCSIFMATISRWWLVAGRVAGRVVRGVMVGAPILAFLAIFLMRFVFYMSHMTCGISY